MAGKRGRQPKGAGSKPRKRADGRWQAYATLEGGKRKYFYGQKEGEVRRKVTAATRDRDSGLAGIYDDRQTVAAYLAWWLEKARPNLKPRTYIRYAEEIRLHIMPALGYLHLTRLTPQHIQAFYSAKLKEPRAPGKPPLSPTTVAHFHSIMHHALKDAVRFRAVAFNVADQVDPPRRIKSEAHYLTHDQAVALLKEAQGDRLEALYVLALSTGMRQGELLALRWDDLDWQAGTVRVGGTLHFVTGAGWRIGTAKAEASQGRTMLLSVVAIEALHAHRVRQHAERLAAGGDWHDHGFIFTARTGEPLRGPHVYARRFLPLLARAGIPPRRFHEVRHTAATLWLEAGNQLHAVSKALGHSNSSTTANIYAHVTEGMNQALADTMDRLFQTKEASR